MKTFKVFVKIIEAANPKLDDIRKKIYVQTMCRLWNKNYYTYQVEDILLENITEEEGPHY